MVGMNNGFIGRKKNKKIQRADDMMVRSPFMTRLMSLISILSPIHVAAMLFGTFAFSESLMVGMR
jgi:hypothetical protein